MKDGLAHQLRKAPAQTGTLGYGRDTFEVLCGAMVLHLDVAVMGTVGQSPILVAGDWAGQEACPYCNEILRQIGKSVIRANRLTKDSKPVKPSGE